MTLQECIEKIRLVNTSIFPTRAFAELFDTVSEYDADLAYTLTKNYYGPDDVVDVIHQMDNLTAILNATVKINYGYGMYYENAWGDYEDADLDKLKKDILNELEIRLKVENLNKENNLVNNNEENWVEEDDDFLTSKG